MHLIHVAPDGWNFLDEAGQYFTPFGGNILNDEHPGDGVLFSHFDADDVERRFARMQEYGLNCLRQPLGVNQVYRAGEGLLAEGMRNWHTFISLAERYGVRLMPVGGYPGSNDWFDRQQLADDGASLDTLCDFWARFVPEFAGHPAIFAWDLHNEQLYDLPDENAAAGDAEQTRASLLAGWPAFLQARYGTLAMMNAHYGAWGPYASFAEVPTAVRFINDPGNPAYADFRHYLNEKGYRWSRRQVEVIRAASPNHMVCSGNNGWLFPDMDLWLANGFHNLAHHDLYDFVSIHPYPAPQCLPTGHGDPLNGGEALAFWLDAVEGMARIDYYGKPVVLQEFGWYGGGESKFLCPLPHRSEGEHADYMRTLIERLLPHASGFVNWPLCDMPESTDISNRGGLFTRDMQPKALADVYRDLSGKHAHAPRTRKAATGYLTASLLLLFTSRPYQDEMWEEIHRRTQAGETLDYRFV